MIERRVFPIGWFMTGGTFCAKFAVMVIVLFMAGITISWRAFENAVEMTLLTGDIHMRPFQFKYRKIVIELCRFPAIR